MASSKKKDRILLTQQEVWIVGDQVQVTQYPKPISNTGSCSRSPPHPNCGSSPCDDDSSTSQFPVHISDRKKKGLGLEEKVKKVHAS